jgi:hypothetical protein
MRQSHPATNSQHLHTHTRTHIDHTRSSRARTRNTTAGTFSATCHQNTHGHSNESPIPSHRTHTGLAYKRTLNDSLLVILTYAAPCVTPSRGLCLPRWMLSAIASLPLKPSVILATTRTCADPILRRYFLAFRCTFAGPPAPLGAAELWPLVLCLAAVAFRDRVFIIAARVEVPAPSTPQPLHCSAITHTPTHAVSAAPTCGSTGTAVCTLRCTDTCCSHSALQATTTRRLPSASAFSSVTLPHVRLRLA